MTAGPPAPTRSLRLNGVERPYVDDDATLLEVLREQLGCHSAKDGCSPQGQCGCCTVWVDGAARAACVTPARRAADRSVTTVEGLPGGLRERWTAAFEAAGASQCGFCTPGILMRLAALGERPSAPDEAAVETALLAHLCRCTGWRTVVEAACAVLGVQVGDPTGGSATGVLPARDPLLSAWRAALEGRAPQTSDPRTIVGEAGFADDTAPADALVAVLGDSATSGGDETQYSLGPTLAHARRRTGKVQGRRSTLPLRHPVAPPEGDWALSLRTTWVEPAYLEPDASWCVPGGRPSSPLANGGAFGGKRHSPVPDVARRLADREGAPVRVLWSHEAVVRHGPKRPPVAAGVRPDGSGVLHVGTTPGGEDPSRLAGRVASVLPDVRVVTRPVAGPPLSHELRGAGWAEAWALRCGLDALARGEVGDPGAGGRAEVTTPDGARARVEVGADDVVAVELWAGEPLDPVSLRSYCLGAVHQALGWVWQEGIAVDEAGQVQDLTVRSFGVLTARDTPPVHVTLHPSDTWPVGGSDAVLAATAAAAWIAEGLPPSWPTRREASGVHR